MINIIRGILDNSLNVSFPYFFPHQLWPAYLMWRVRLHAVKLFSAIFFIYIIR